MSVESGCCVLFVCLADPQDESTGEITFYMKGADVVMAGIVQYNDWLEEEVGVCLVSGDEMNTYETLVGDESQTG